LWGGLLPVTLISRSPVRIAASPSVLPASIAAGLVPLEPPTHDTVPAPAVGSVVPSALQLSGTGLARPLFAQLVVSSMDVALVTCFCSPGMTLAEAYVLGALDFRRLHVLLSTFASLP
jgi:hypothetical protein